MILGLALTPKAAALAGGWVIWWFSPPEWLLTAQAEAAIRAWSEAHPRTFMRLLQLRGPELWIAGTLVCTEAT